MTVVVIGAGLAGIAAAVRLLDQGVRVLLLERSPFPGGRAGSSYDRRAQRELDLGQHVYLYCCERYRALLARLGTASLAPLQSPLHIPIFDARTFPDAESTAPIYVSPLPTGLHLAPAFFRYTHLTLQERLITARLAVKLARADRDNPKYEKITFGAWLRAQGASDNSIAAFWNVVTVAALNASVDDVSAAWGLMLFQVGLLTDRRAAEVGIPRVPLSRLVAPVADLLADSGGELRLACKASRIIIKDGAARGVVLATGERVTAQAVIAAVTHQQLGGLIPEPMRSHPYFAELSQLPTRTIIDLHLGFTEPVTPKGVRFGVFLHSPVQWLFAHDEGRHLAISISNPRRAAGRRVLAIKETIIAEVRRLFASPPPVWAVMRRHRSATFDLSPGMSHLRRAQRSPVPGLYVAGDWTATGWPATMEGAVRSGEMAAEALLADVL